MTGVNETDQSNELSTIEPSLEIAYPLYTFRAKYTWLCIPLGILYILLALAVIQSLRYIPHYLHVCNAQDD
jgi:hypothetical protein